MDAVIVALGLTVEENQFYIVKTRFWGTHMLDVDETKRLRSRNFQIGEKVKLIRSTRGWVIA